MAGGMKVGGVHRGSDGPGRAWVRGVVGYKLGDSGFSVVFLFRSPLPGILHPSALFFSLSFSLLLPLTLPPDWDSSSTSCC